MFTLDTDMKKLIEKLKTLLKGSSGFTLIELLVVIGILGVLAAALIATIDPFEQLKKSQDASTKNTLVEFVDANVRYYATHNIMPWVSGGVTNCATSSTSLAAASGLNCISGLIADGELKGSFSQATSILSNIRYFGDPSSNPGVTACFLPLSKSQKKDPNTIYNASGVSVGASGTYWCAN